MISVSLVVQKSAGRSDCGVSKPSCQQDGDGTDGRTALASELIQRENGRSRRHQDRPADEHKAGCRKTPEWKVVPGHASATPHSRPLTGAR
jgi:hypothetical protein